MLLLFATAVFPSVMADSGWPRSLKARVVDVRTREPLIGVTVQVEKSSAMTITNIDGDFQLQVQQASDKVVFSYIGYKPITIQASVLAGKSVVEMTEDDGYLEEIVVVGYGVQKKTTHVGSITQVGGNDLVSTGSVNSVSEALQGKLNGVVSIATTGQPGENTANIFIRGKSTWGDTSPLILVDGIERDMNDIDMNEIETVSVLKDASATAVYGVRGGNGVILITTKRGNGSAPKVSFSANYTWKAPTTSMHLADHASAMKAYNIAMANDGSWDKIIPLSTIEAWQLAQDKGLTGPYSDVFPYVNWWDELIGSGFTQNYNINLRGGNDRMNYFASLGYQGDGDIYQLHKNDQFDPRHTYKRYNWRSNFDFNLTSTTKLSLSIAGKMGYRNKSLDNDNPFYRILTESTSDHPIRYSDGNWGDDEEKNPVANMNMAGADLRKTFEGWYDAAIEQNLDFITKGLKARAKISYSTLSRTSTNTKKGGGSADLALKSIVRYHRTYDYENPIVAADGTITYPLLEEKRLPNSETVFLPAGVIYYDQLDGYARQLYYEMALSYDHRFGKHNVSALALFNRQVNDSKDGGNIRFPSYYEDWVGRITYNWSERYLAEANVSYTGSEKFARGHRFGLFPSFSVGWRISEEPFIKKSASLSRILTNAKIRYSWGKVGSDAGASRWNYIQTYQSGGAITLGSSQAHNWGPLYTEGAIANENATWEKSVKQNLGIEIGLWDRLSIVVDLFAEKRHDILMTPNTTSSITGATFNAINMGEVKNHGVEAELKWQDTLGKDFHYHVGLSMSASENRVVFRDDPYKTPEHLKLAGKPVENQVRYLAVGNYSTIDDVFNYAQSGSINSVAPNQVIPGDLVYIDFDSDGVLNGQDKVAVSQLSYPQRTYTFNLGFEYKGFSFSTLIYTPRGVYKLVDTSFTASFKDGKINAQPDALSAWTRYTATPSGVISPSLHLNNSGAFNGTESTWRFQDFSYVRLKSVELGYRLPRQIANMLHASGVQVYLQGYNLLTWWQGDDRIDPEGNQTRYPILKSVTAGLRVSF